MKNLNGGAGVVRNRMLEEMMTPMESEKRNLFGQGFAREIRDSLDQARSAFEAASDLLKAADSQLFKEMALQAILFAILQEPARRAVTHAEYLAKELGEKRDE